MRHLGGGLRLGGERGGEKAASNHAKKGSSLHRHRPPQVARSRAEHNTSPGYHGADRSRTIHSIHARPGGPARGMSGLTVLFDLDGTLTDSRAGITASIRHALDRLAPDCPRDEGLATSIGPPPHRPLPTP